MESTERLAEDFKLILNRYGQDYSNLYNKRILITGVCGMIAEYLVHLFMYMNLTQGAGIHVIGVCRRKQTSDAKYSKYSELGFYQCIEADVRFLENVTGNVDFIIHAASPTSPYVYENNPADVATINMLGTWRILELAKEKHADLLLISSSSIYGSGAGEYLTQNSYGSLSTTEVRSCYSEGKRAAETLCVAYHHQYGVKTKIARCRRVYGPTANLKSKSLLNKLIQATAACETIEMFKDPDNMLQLLYVGDAATGILKVLLYGNTGEAYNVSSDSPISVDALAEELAAFKGNYKLTINWIDRHTLTDNVRTKAQKDRNNACCVNDKLCALNWEPLFSLQQGLLRTVEELGDEQ